MSRFFVLATLIEYATFMMPIQVFLVDSAYHVFFEATVAGLILAAVYARLHPQSESRSQKSRG